LDNPNRKLPVDERCVEADFEYILELQIEKDLDIFKNKKIYIYFLFLKYIAS